MPRGVRRRAKARDDWTREQRRQLLDGHEFFGKGFGRPWSIHRPLDLDLARVAWNELRAEILDEFIANNPGHRPWAWWQFDAPEPRRQPETDLAYLERLNLLVPSEIAVLDRLRAEDAASVAKLVAARETS